MILDQLDTPIRVDQPVPGTIEGHRRYVDGGAWAYWVLGDVQWSFRTIKSRTAAIHRMAAEMSSAAGHQVELFVDHVPFNATSWAADLDAVTRHPLPDVDGCDETWATVINRGQEDLADALVPVAMFGVRLGTASKRRKQGDELPADLLAFERTLDEQFAKPGLGARKALAREIAWLIYGANVPGHPVPPFPEWDHWDEDEVKAFGTRRTWEQAPAGRTVKVTVEHDGVLTERHVAVLTMGRMEQQTFPENGRTPWLAFAQTLKDPVTDAPIPVRVAVKGRILAGAEAKTSAEKWMRRAKAIRKHYEEHDEDLPPTVDRTIDHAVDVFDQVTEQPPDIAARFHGVARFAVAADNAEDAEAYARLLEAHYSDPIEGQGMWPTQPGGLQEPLAASRMLREFTPGVQPDLSGHLRELPLLYLAAGVANMGTTVGTPGGFHEGWTLDANPQPVFNDGHYPMRHNKPGDPNNNSGFMAVVGNLGSGKSYKLASTAEARVRAGIVTKVLDGSPGAPLSRLCLLPHLAPYSVHIRLDGAQAGLLNPYSMVPVPVRERREDDAHYRARCVAAEGDRKELVVEKLMDLLPESDRLSDGMEHRMSEAVFEAGGAFGTNPRRVLDRLAPKAPAVARRLVEMSEGVARLLFPADTPSLIKEVPKAALLTVISLGDLPIPAPGSARHEWSSRERAANVSLELAVHLVSSAVYAKPMTEPVSVILDEFRVTEESRSLRTLFRKLGPDGRKYWAEIIVGGQDPDVLVKLGVGPFLGGWWFGRQLDIEVAEICLAMGNAPIEYAPVLLDLHPGEFLVRDTFGRMKLMRVKRAHDSLDQVLDAAWTDAEDPEPLEALS